MQKKLTVGLSLPLVLTHITLIGCFASNVFAIRLYPHEIEDIPIKRHIQEEPDPEDKIHSIAIKKNLDSICAQYIDCKNENDAKELYLRFLTFL